MQKYYIVNVSDFKGLPASDDIDSISIEQFNSTGIEEFNIDEQKVDELLGERSYSGADLPISVIEEVEGNLNFENGNAKKYYFTNPNDAKKFQSYLISEYDIESQLDESDIQDWDLEWKKSYAPILIGNELEIIPSWNKEDYTSKAINQLYIYPGMGFGTGNHETTFLCLKLLLKIDFTKSNISCLDFGCGSGILGFALRILNETAHIDLYDIDQSALDNCKQNLTLNEISEENIRYMLPRDKNDFSKKYEIVFANILKNVLEDEERLILSKVMAGGYLIVSGLLDGQQNDIIDLYTRPESKIKLVEVMTKGDWVAILFARL